MSLISVVYIVKKMSKELARTSTMTAIINIIIDLILIKFIGLYAASISTFIAYFSITIYRWIDIKKYITITLEKKEIIILLISFLVITFFYYIKVGNIIAFICAIVISVYLNKDNLYKILKGVKYEKINK